MESDFTRWCLWSRNQKDQPQGIISHNSALALHGFGQHDPRKVHITVPLRFQKKIPDEVVIHNASLNISSIESRSGFMVTRLCRTLMDLRKELEAKGEWNRIIDNVVAEERLSREEIKNITAIFLPGEYKFSAGSSSSQSETACFNQIGTQPDTGHVFDPVSEGVWKMIYARTETRCRRSQGGFTLVELLFVVAIISVLAAMLMPMLQQSLASARYIICANNIKQMYFAMMNYSDANRQYIPPINNGTYYWTQSPVLSGDYFGLATNTQWHLAPYPGSCPLAENITWNPAHAYNAHVNDYKGSVGLASPKPVKWQRGVLNSSRTVLFIDGAYGMQIDLRWGASMFNVGYFHATRTSCVFFDGHTEKRAAPDIPSSMTDAFWVGH